MKKSKPNPRVERLLGRSISRCGRSRGFANSEETYGAGTADLISSKHVTAELCKSLCKNDGISARRSHLPQKPHVRAVYPAKVRWI